MKKIYYDGYTLVVLYKKTLQLNSILCVEKRGKEVPMQNFIFTIFYYIFIIYLYLSIDFLNI